MIFAMCDFSRYLIRDNVTVREALIALNRLSNDTLVLFVIDRDRRLVGTLTDGDVRRGLIEGLRIVSRRRCLPLSVISMKRSSVWNA